MKTLASLAALAAALTLSSAAHADAVANLEALTGSHSDGGATITNAEADAYAAGVTAYSGDSAVSAITAAYRLRGEGAFAGDDAYATVIANLRYRVQGLAVSQLQAPGLAFSRASNASPLTAAFDARGVSYAAVDLIYTWDGWTTTGAVTLAPKSDGSYTAAIDGAPPDGRLEYAMHLFGDDGRDFWLNNGRDLGVYGGTYHLNYSLDLAAALVPTAAPTAPAFGQLVATFTDDTSPGGDTITNSELSLLVEQITWEGGPGVEDRRALRPALDALHDLEQAGAPAEPNAIANMRAFIEAVILPEATFPGIFFDRGAGGALTATMGEQPATAATVIYSTDGWNIAAAIECPRNASTDLLECSFGHIPPGAHISYAIALHQPDGDVTWIRSTLGNFFHSLPE